MTSIRVEINRNSVSDERDAAGRAQELLVRATIVAPDQVESAERRLPLHIAIVIDRSGSMAGQKLDDAIAAAQRMVQRLDAEDRCVVVAFDSTVSVLADGAPLTDARRTMIGHALGQVRPGSSTNLAGGWDAGVQLLLQHHVANECVSRVVILTDGAANVGLRDRDGLAAQAKIYADRGISTSTYGLGKHYNESTLTAISQAGLGNHQFIELSADIDEFFGQELRELFAIALTDTVLTAELPTGYTCELIGGQQHTIAQQTLRVALGALVALEQRSFFLRLTPLSLLAHGTHRLVLTLTGVDSARQPQQAVGAVTWELTTAARAAQAVSNPEIEQEAGLIDLARVRAEANRLNAEGRYSDARSFIYEQQTRSVIFSKMRLYEEAADLFARPMSSSDRKTEESANYMRRRASSKDLSMLRRRLERLIQEGAPRSELEAIQAEITRLERW